MSEKSRSRISALSGLLLDYEPLKVGWHEVHYDWKGPDKWEYRVRLDGADHQWGKDPPKEVVG
jgi:hypothetical protein